MFDFLSEISCVSEEVYRKSNSFLIRAIILSVVECWFFNLIDSDEGVETHKQFCISVLRRIKFGYTRRQINLC